MKVLKFGGTSLESPARVQAVVRIVAERVNGGNVALVVSAFGGVTDALASVAALAAQGASYEAPLEEVAERHRRAAETLASPEERGSVVAIVDESARSLRDLLQGVSLVRECSARTLDAILGHGELLSAALVAAALRRSGVAAERCDARSIVVTDQSFGAARVDAEETRRRISDHFAQARGLQVVTGFLGSTRRGETTTLGRGGSDYTAALLGAALNAEVVEIWTDVDGVMSADPRLVPNAFSIPQLTYLELQELSHFGAKVVYPPTLHAAAERSLPLLIRNTLNPSFPGSRVVQRAPAREGNPVRGIASITQVALLRLEGSGVAGMRGIAHRLFGALARDGVQPILITQGSSGHSICFAVAPADLERAMASVAEEFQLEQRAGWIDELVVETDCSVIAAVGEAMRQTPGVSGRLFGVLGRNGVNVRAIAQGSSELNITVVVGERDHARALRAIHDAFFFPTSRSVKVFIAGVGRVGGALVDQILAEADDLRAQTGIGITLAGLADSRRAAVSTEALEPGRWREALRPAGDGATGLERLVEAATAAQDAPRVFVDCTASAALAQTYPRLLSARMAVVSANKLGFSGPLQRYRALREAASEGVGLYYETTVGAGLPVLRTITDLIATGDHIRCVEGVLSGTLGFVCDSLMAGAAFHEAVRTAHERGWTEPDPREDLSGGDVARKILILAREAGFEVDPESVETCPLLEDAWLTMPIAEFWERLPRADESFRQRADAARARGNRLCYLARFDSERGRVGLEEIAADHPCAGLRGTDNLIVIHSDRYAEAPLVIRGPGAGPQVTAGGLFADILRAVRESLW